jgi:DNA-binding NarL/FixJ family response regulator
LRVEHPEIKVLVFSQYDELIFAERTLRAGALGYVMKENATEELLRAIQKILAGDIYVSERLAATFVRRSLERKPSVSHTGIERLSDRELQVFQLIGASYSTREIADEFHLSVKTIETHRENIKSKLGLENATELNRFAEAWTVKNLLPIASEPEPARPCDRKR